MYTHTVCMYICVWYACMYILSSTSGDWPTSSPSPSSSTCSPWRRPPRPLIHLPGACLSSLFLSPPSPQSPPSPSPPGRDALEMSPNAIGTPFPQANSRFLILALRETAFFFRKEKKGGWLGFFLEFFVLEVGSCVFFFDKRKTPAFSAANKQWWR